MFLPNTGYAFLTKIDQETYKVLEISSKYPKTKLKKELHVKIVNGTILTKFNQGEIQVSVVSEDDIIMIVSQIEQVFITE